MLKIDRFTFDKKGNFLKYIKMFFDFEELESNEVSKVDKKISFLEHSFEFSKYLYSMLVSFYGLGRCYIVRIFAYYGLGFSSQLNGLIIRLLISLEQKLRNTSLFLLEARLKFVKRNYIKRLYDLRIYRAYRLSCGLPLRGQRSKTNASTMKKFRKNYEY